MLACLTEEHRAITTLLQRTRFCEALLSCTHVVPMGFTSASALLRQVRFSLPTFRLPCGFQSRACLVTFEEDLLSVWPIHPHILFLISRCVNQALIAVMCLQHNFNTIVRPNTFKNTGAICHDLRIFTTTFQP